MSAYLPVSRSSLIKADVDDFKVITPQIESPDARGEAGAMLHQGDVPVKLS